MHQLGNFAAAFILMYVLLSQADGAALTSDVQNSIETRVVVDKVAIARWKNNFTSPMDSESRRLSVTKAQMTEFIHSVFVGVNAIFKGLNSSGINLDARIVSIEFITYETISTDVYDGNRVSADRVLETFRTWLKTKRYPRTDHTLLFSGWDLSNGTSSGVAGVAYLGKMCGKAKSLSAVEIRSAFGSVVQTVAHELGHSLNSSHDGDGNTCPVDSAMIMDFNGGANSTKNFQFSSCSINYIKTFLTKLHSSSSGSCLSADNTVTPEVQGEAMGQLYDPDTICRMSIGSNSFFGRSFYGPGRKHDYSQICTAIWCYNEGGNNYLEVAGTDGFTCGKGKVCELGYCVPSSNISNSVSDTCPFGDAPNDANVYDGMSCNELITSEDASLCYNGYFRSSCCGSCEAARTDVEGCEYGDKASWCLTANYPYSCYYGNDQTCCASCPQYATGPPGCEYGDKASSCLTRNYPHDCYYYNRTCCASCPQYATGPPGCEYGDKASWCQTTNYPYSCYRNDRTCCSSCPQYATGPPGCEYGDKASSCLTRNYPHDCYYYNRTCCASCPQYATGPPECKYGDKSTDCENLRYPQACYLNDELCCATCKRHVTNDTECLYGDKANACDMLPYPYTCYLNGAICCGSCKAYETSIPGCKYGDKQAWCETMDSRNCPLNTEQCCETCR